MSLLTGGAAKELLPIGGVPLVLRVMEECAASGITEVLVVSAPGKSDLDDAVLSAAGSSGMPAKVEVVVQEEAHGLADAIRLGRFFAHSAPLAVALPDNLFIGDAPGLSQLIAVYQRTGKSVVAIVKLTAANRDRYGPTAIYPGRVEKDEFVIAQIPDKGPRGQDVRPWRGGGRLYRSRSLRVSARRVCDNRRGRGEPGQREGAGRRSRDAAATPATQAHRMRDARRFSRRWTSVRISRSQLAIRGQTVMRNRFPLAGVCCLKTGWSILGVPYRYPEPED